MSEIFETFGNAWEFLFGWLPSPLNIFATVLVGLIVVILLIKIVAFILDAIPFL